MLILGLVLLLIGWLTDISVLWLIGAVLALVGCVLLLMAGAGRTVGGRRYWY